MFFYRIDAVYERHSDGMIFFFSGRRFWRSDGNMVTGNDKGSHIAISPIIV